MDRVLNHHAKSLGFFLTSGKETSENKTEHDILRFTAAKVQAACFKDGIRANTMITNLTQIGVHTDEIAKAVQAEALEKNFETLKNLDACYAYVSTLFTVYISSYHDFKSKKGRGDRDDHDNRHDNRHDSREPKAGKK